MSSKTAHGAKAGQGSSDGSDEIRVRLPPNILEALDAAAAFGAELGSVPSRTEAIEHFLLAYFAGDDWLTRDGRPGPKMLLYREQMARVFTRE